MANDTLYFYDLETSGINPRSARIMQFAGQRTTLDLEPIGPPDNTLIKMSDDILPEPQAILVTGIAPQQTIADGISEREFCRYFIESIATPYTTILGFNSIRFDNEFIRFLLYRNFYDAYEWSYANGRSVWDMLDVVRMTRALRPDGIEWPFASDGRPSNSLELLTSVNHLQHENAHDALSDVYATIAVAKLIKQTQPKLFSYLYAMRTKQAVQAVVNSGEPFVYTTGRYNGAYEKTSVAVLLADHPVYPGNRALVYDLRFDPTEFLKMSIPDMLERMQYTKDETAPVRLPVKELVYNKCPAVAPLTVLTPSAQKNISIDMTAIQQHWRTLVADPTFTNRVRQAYEDKMTNVQTELAVDIQTVDSQLYNGFFNDADKRKMQQVSKAKVKELADVHPTFDDERLVKLLLLYKARLSKEVLSADEQLEWNQYVHTKLTTGTNSMSADDYFSLIQKLAVESAGNQRNIGLLEDLWLWGESIIPAIEH